VDALDTELDAIYRRRDGTLPDYGTKLSSGLAVFTMGGLAMTHAIILVFALLAAPANTQARNAEPTGSPNFQYSLIRSYGVMVAGPNASQRFMASLGNNLPADATTVELDLIVSVTVKTITF
jgi:hypothetical protein